MIEQLKTIQTGLAIAIDAEGFVDKPVRRALLDAVKAAAQLEAMVGKQEPVAYYYQKHNCFGQLVWNVGFVAPRDATHCHPLYTAAPVAQQQAKPHKPLFSALIAQHPGLREELLEMDKQPQAEAAPNTLQKAEAHLLNLIGEYWGLAYAEGEEGRNHDTEDGAAQRTHAAIAKAVKDLIAAASSTPQQAEAVPVAVLRRGEGGAFSVTVGENLLAVYALPPGNHDLFTRPQQAEAVPPDVVRLLQGASDWICEHVPIGTHAATTWAKRLQDAAIAQQKGGV